MKRWLSNIFRPAGTTESSLWTQPFLKQAVHASTTHRFVDVCNPKVWGAHNPCLVLVKHLAG